MQKGVNGLCRGDWIWRYGGWRGSKSGGNRAPRYAHRYSDETLQNASVRLFDSIPIGKYSADRLVRNPLVH